MPLHLAIYHPAIPQNTGNLGRLCVGMGAELHIIGPCSFNFSDTALRRAGLDYWPHLTWTLHPDEDAFLDWLGGREPWLVTKFGQQRYDHAKFSDGDIMVLGNENTGLPRPWLRRWPERCLAIPICGPIRSFNVANAGAMVLSSAAAACGHFNNWSPIPIPEAAAEAPPA
ncbi:MAG: hypothetical protein EA402_03965 [Planctomycetota bacterium]|nr:MAG: hypothetical protein EA402_03965 [Planctomycetota bacterium]